MQIVQLTAENLLRLKAVSITPEGSMVVVSGKNGAGKSSVLTAIECALGGKAAIPDEPIHRGKRKARIVADLGDIVVERTFTHAGSKLVVKDRDGKTVKSPQRLLDDLVSRITFDPLEFATMDPREQDRVLRELVGVDFTELDADRKAIYEQRTNENREAKQLEARLQSMPPMSTGVPDCEVSVADLIEELRRREAEERHKRHLAEALERAEDADKRASGAVQRQKQLIDELEAKLSEARQALSVAIDEEDDAFNAREASQKALDSYTYDDPAEIKTQLSTVDETNRKVRQNSERSRVSSSLDAARMRSTDLTEAIDSIDQQKAEMLEKAEYPIPGLGLDESGVLLDGLPFDQACTSAKIRASIAIGAALNPKLRVLLVRRGNDLDRDRLREVAQMAEEMGLQVWVERIEDGGMPAVVIEDGEVVEG